MPLAKCANKLIEPETLYDLNSCAFIEFNEDENHGITLHFLILDLPFLPASLILPPSNDGMSLRPVCISCFMYLPQWHTFFSFSA